MTEESALERLLPIKQIRIDGTPQRLARILDIVGIPATFDADTGVVTLDELEVATSESAGLLSPELFQALAHGAPPDTAKAEPDTYARRNTYGELWANAVRAKKASALTLALEDLDVASTDANWLYAFGQDLASGASDGRSGGTILCRVGRPKTARDCVDSPGNFVLDLGSCASGHSYQSGAQAFRVNLSGAPGGSMVIGLDTAFFGSGSSVPTVFRWATDISLGMSWYAKYGSWDFSGGGSGALAQIELPTASTFGFRVYIGTTAFQVTNSAITLGRAATFSSTVSFSSTLLSGITFDASLSSVAIGWAQDASAAGGAMTIRGQKGASGYVGGVLTLGGGDGGTPGTNLAGDTQVELGQTVSGATAELSCLSAGTRVGGFKVDTNGRFYISNAASISSAGIMVEATSGYIALKGATLSNVESGGDWYATVGSASKKITQFQTPSAQATQQERHQTGTTANATPTTIGAGFSIANSRAGLVLCRVLGFKDDTHVAGYLIAATVRASGGTATIVGQTALHTAEDTAGWDCVLTASGGSIYAQVTGEAATLRWEVYWDTVLGAA